MSATGIALVTGANKGLGKEIARQLGQRGLHVLLGSRDVQRGTAAALELQHIGVRAEVVALDVTDDASVTAAVRQVEEKHGCLDVLIANAGILRRVATFQTTATAMRETFETNVFGVVRTIQATLPLLERSARPRIVTIASTTASHALCSDATSLYGSSDTILAYASSKAAVTMLTVQYASAFRRSAAHAHFKINAATPGHIATDLNDHQGSRTAEQGAQIVVELAMLDEAGPSGKFFNDQGIVPW